jgi:hypothetical protein
MCPPSTPREKKLAAALFLLISGLGALFFIDDHPSSSSLHRILRFAAAGCLLLGWVWFHTVRFVQSWERNPMIRSAHKSPDGAMWLRIVAVILSLGVLPLAFLGLYHNHHFP